MDRSPSFAALRIAGFYALVGALWIIGSDRLLEMMVPDLPTFSLIQTYKGWAFVLASGFLIFLLLDRELKGRLEDEKMLREGEQRYRSLFDNMLDGLAYCKMLFEDGKPQDFIYLDVNDSFERLTGLKNIIGKKVTEVIPGIKESNPELFEIYGRVALTGNPERLETYIGSLGNWFSISVYSTKREHFAAVFDNITERKKAEEELRESEQKYRDLFDGAPVGIFQSTIDGRVLSVNQSYAKMFGYASAEEAALEIDNVAERIYVEPERRQKLIDLALRSDGFVKAENQYRKEDGSLFSGQLYFRVVRDRDGEMKHLEGFVEDITNRKMAEEGLRKREAELRASQAQFEAFMDNSPLIAFMRDDQGRYVYVNRLFLSNNNLSSSQVLGKTADEIFPEEMAHKVTKEDLNVVESHTTIASVESLVDHTGDQREWWLIRFPVRDADGLRYLGGVGLDLTESIRAQKALEASEARFRQIYERVPIMIHSADRDGMIRNVNRRWLSHMGYDREEVIGHSLDDFITREPGAEPSLVRSQLWAEGTASNVQRRYVKKDGSIIDSVLDSIIIDDPVLGRVSLTAVNDITALKRAEDEIKKSLEEKEVLLREINHRVKNNLQVMSSLLRLQTRQASDESGRHVLQETQNRLQTMGLIHETLHQSTNLAYIDVEGYLKRLIANLFSLYGAKSSQIETTIDAQELRLGVDKADPLGLIANELVSNCLKHAFPSGRQGIIRISLALESHEFEFMVSDNGLGLREDFDPFAAQTLGLHLVNTLVKQLRGEIIVKRSAGTEFCIRFPVSAS